MDYGTPDLSLEQYKRGAADLGLEPGARVVVAMSGGVDSSVVAALLKEAGYETIGITLQLYDHGTAIKKQGACCAGDDIHDARRVAERLDMPHYVLDYESRFRDAVMEDFADAYLRGETPIPCVRCNQRVKFADLFSMAQDLGAAALATGHYVQRRTGQSGSELHRAIDETRDQSYFLFATTQPQLDYLRFPLGGMPKTMTRELAESYGLRVADKPDSQDICFVPEGRYASVIEKLRPGAIDPGDIVHIDGRILGRHEGIIHFTVGQRRGLGVATGEPLFVVRLDAATKRVFVGPKEALGTAGLTVNELNWLGAGPLPSSGQEVLVKVRSTRPPVLARLRTGSGPGKAELEFIGAEEGVAPGQAAVFYDVADGGERVLGGGWIESTRAADPRLTELLAI